MFPFRDHNPSGRVAYVTYALIAANVIIFLLSLGANLNWLYANFALVPAWVSEGQNLSGYLTSMFLHGGWMHLIGNMLFLWIFGDNIEDMLGHFWFLVFYLVCGVIASWSHVVFNPSSTIPLIGASGAIAGVMGAYLVLFPRARVDVLVILVIIIRTFALPSALVLLIWLGLQVISGFSMPSQGGGVAYWAHFGGFIAGMLMILPVWLRLGATKFWQASHYHPPHPATSVREIGRVPTIRRR